MNVLQTCGEFRDTGYLGKQVGLSEHTVRTHSISTPESKLKPNMPLLQDDVSATSALRNNATTAAALSLTVMLLIPVLYRLYLHPLRHVAGPILGRASSLFMYTICYLGTV